MKVFNITYDNPPRQGTATVQSTTAEKACTLLQSYGQLNAGRYSITSVTEVGCNDSLEEKILTESYGEPIIQKDSPTIEENPKFDINKLSDEDIKTLKLRLDKYSKIIHVDKIGALRVVCRNGTNRVVADDGYTVFVTSNSPWIIIDGKQFKVRIYHLYVVKDHKYIDLGCPIGKEIVSPVRRVKIDPRKNFSSIEIEHPNPCYINSTKNCTLTELYRGNKKYGIFLLQRKKRRNRGERGYKITYTWRYYDRILLYELNNDVAIRRRLKADLEMYPEHNIKLDRGKTGVYHSTGGKATSGVRKSFYYTFCIGEVLKRRPRDLSITTGWSGECPTHMGIGWSASHKLKGLPIKIYKIQSYKRSIRVYYPY